MCDKKMKRDRMTERQSKRKDKMKRKYRVTAKTK